MAALIASHGAMHITRYTGPARTDYGPRTRYQITRREPATVSEIGSDYITLDGQQLRDLAAALADLADRTGEGDPW